VVIEAVCLAQTVVQFDRFVARNQPLAILPTVVGNIFSELTLKASLLLSLNKLLLKILREN